MRYEMMCSDDKVMTLRRLYKRLNKYVYGKCLPFPLIRLGTYDPPEGQENTLAFFGPEYGIVFVDKVLTDGRIQSLTTTEQWFFITRIMLHEMAHQYCYVNNIKDYNHGKEWQEVAIAHGLDIFLYGDNPDIDDRYEFLSPMGMLPLVNYRLF